MQPQVGFKASYQRYLAVEQRRAVLQALAHTVNHDATVGDVLDAAEVLGWGTRMGELSLADLAEALLAEASELELDDDDEAAPELAEVEAEDAKKTRSSKTKKAGAANTKKKKASKKSSAKKPVAARKTARSTKGSGKKKLGSSRLRALKRKIDADERMSLEEAAELFLPIVEELGDATMQDLEDSTGVGRRKLRFHVGQLVRNDRLERHGMGRGTYYTLT